MEFRFDVMLCSNLGNENSDAILNVTAGRRFLTLVLKESVTEIVRKRLIVSVYLLKSIT